jgi:hypothetical protein
MTQALYYSPHELWGCLIEDIEMDGDLVTDSRDRIDAQVLNGLQDFWSGTGSMTSKQEYPLGGLNTHSGATP